MVVSVKLRLCLIALLVAVAIPASARAADNQPSANPQAGITISPPLQKVTLGPGLLEAKTHVIVTNTTKNKFSATIDLVDFKSLNETGGLTLGQVGVPLWKYGLANWMNVSNGKEFTLAPGESTNLEVGIQNRSDLTPGGHYGAVLIKGKAQTPAGTQLDFNQNLASLLFVKKLGGEKYGMELTSFESQRSHDLPQSVTMGFKSTGNVYVIPRGYIEVRDPLGELVEKGIINENSNLIMQESTQKLITLLKPVDKPSHKSGKYSITAYYRYDGQSDYSKKTVYFNRGLISYKLIVIAIATGVFLLIVFVPKHFRKKMYSTRPK
jgi:hypothetical protein